MAMSTLTLWCVAAVIDQADLRLQALKFELDTTLECT